MTASLGITHVPILRDMPITMDSCFPKFKRPALSSSGEEEEDLRPVSILIRNFNSLYSTTAPPPLSPELQYGSTAYGASKLDLSAVYASRRFFISSPGQSNSIIDSLGSSASSSSLESDGTLVMKNSVAVLTHSPDPYADFKRSMAEMVEAHKSIHNDTSNWEYLHELLLCYLALNPETTHKFIIGAFADLVVDLISAPAAKRTGARHRKASRNVKGYMLK